MILAVVRQRLREGRRPPRDVVLAFLADEEAGGSYGARYLVDNHPACSRASPRRSARSAGSASPSAASAST